MGHHSHPKYSAISRQRWTRAVAPSRSRGLPVVRARLKCVQAGLAQTNWMERRPVVPLHDVHAERGPELGEPVHARDVPAPPLEGAVNASGARAQDERAHLLSAGYQPRPRAASDCFPRTRLGTLGGTVFFDRSAFFLAFFISCHSLAHFFRCSVHEEDEE